MVGTFSISREIWDHPEFRPSAFSEREAFIWMISEAAWKPRCARSGPSVVDLDRGQFCHSVRFMAKAFGWSKDKVHRFLKRLSTRDMIQVETATGGVIVTVCNYNKYQPSRDTTATAPRQQPRHDRDSTATNENKGIREEGNKSVISDTDASPKTPAAVLAETLGEEMAREVVAHRQRLRKALTPKAAELLARKLAKCPDPIKAAEIMLEKGWQSVDPEWIANLDQKNDGRKQPDVMGYLKTGGET